MKKTIALVFAAAALAGCQRSSDNTGSTTSTADTNVISSASRNVNEPAGSATNTTTGQTPATAPNTKSSQR